MTDAASRAEERVARVRDDPAGRYAPAREFYQVASGPRRRYGHAELSFMRWSLARVVLAPETAERPGSPWWRAVNERLLRDKTEAHLLCAGNTAAAGARSVEFRVHFSAHPTPAAGTARTTPASSRATWSARTWPPPSRGWSGS
ncbi:hypothetical protein ACIP98_37650 [Streptomyces sp. NPDC088354]|uniref:hypothetical protein n=1 Tax=Streptomyces sp. NPDC088354 TaxID=3365856 RepID=UPI00381EB242